MQCLVYTFVGSERYDEVLENGHRVANDKNVRPYRLLSPVSEGLMQRLKLSLSVATILFHCYTD